MADIRKAALKEQKKRFGDRLRTLRINAGLTQHQLAEKAGYKPQVITRYETGGVFPRPEAIEKLAAALDVPAADLDGSNNNADKIKLALELEKYHIEGAFFGDDYEIIGLRSPDIGGVAMPFYEFEAIMKKTESQLKEFFEARMNAFFEQTLKFYLMELKRLHLYHY